MNKKAIIIKLSKIASVLPGQSPSSNFYSYSEGTPFLQGNRKFGHLYPTFDIYTKKITKLAKKGDVLMSVRAPVGDLNLAPCDLCIGRGLASINAKNGDNWFIYYALKYNIKNLLRQGAATTFDSVNRDIINDFELIIPEKNIDRTNASKVLSLIDRKIELNNKISSELEAMTKVIFNYWFVQFDFPDNKEKPYKSNGGKMVWNKKLKRVIPEAWEEDILGNIIDIKKGISYSSSDINSGNKFMINLNSFNLDGTYKPEGIKMCKVNHSEKGFAYPGDLLIASTDVTRKAEIIGKAILVPNYYSKGVVYSMDVSKIVPSDKIYKSYLKMLFNSKHYHDYIKWYASGTLVLHLIDNGVKWYPLEKPPKSLLEKWSELYSHMFLRISETQTQNQNLSQLRDFLIPLLMNGQVAIQTRKICP
jgi:type I restriction enzyme, S subunit